MFLPVRLILSSTIISNKVRRQKHINKRCDEIKFSSCIRKLTSFIRYSARKPVGPEELPSVNRHFKAGKAQFGRPFCHQLKVTVIFILSIARRMIQRYYEYCQRTKICSTIYVLK